jgi:hypothetical protein
VPDVAVLANSNFIVALAVKETPERAFCEDDD